MKILFFVLMFASSAVAYANGGPNDASSAAASPSTKSGVEQEDGERLVCERRRPLGSQRMERVCMTVAQREAAKEAARQDLQRLGRCSGNDSICAGSL